METQKRVKVSDWSQPIKLVLIVFLGVGAYFGYYELMTTLKAIQKDGTRVNQVGGTSPLYRFNITATSSVAIGNARVQVTGSDGRRAYVKIENVSNVPFWCLEEGDIAAANSAVASSSNPAGPFGHYINARSTTTQASNFWEISGYTGAINCTLEGSTNATATVTTAS